MSFIDKFDVYLANTLKAAFCWMYVVQEEISFLHPLT
jgi:hypothetical protein